MRNYRIILAVLFIVSVASIIDNMVLFISLYQADHNIIDKICHSLAATGISALVVIGLYLYLIILLSRQNAIEKMKADFTDNFTHELKTPIAIARTSSDILLQFPDMADKAHIQEHASAIFSQLDKLSVLVDNILEISTKGRNRVLKLETIRLKLFLSDLLELYALCADKPCDFSVDCPEEMTIKADQTIFYHIISNLIDNSIKYSDKSAYIRIKADAHSLSIIDHGIGIPKKAMPHLFKKFYRVNHDHQQSRRGYGIGLFYVRMMVKKHGWEIDAESKEGEGSTFIIVFNPNNPKRWIKRWITKFCWWKTTPSL